LVAESLPIIVIDVQLLVVHVTFVLQQFENLLWPASLRSVVEQSGLLLNKPLPQLFISAIGKSADEVRYVVVLGFLVIVSSFLREKSTTVDIVDAFHIQLMLSGILVDFESELITLAIFVGIVEELNLLQHLESADGH